MWKERHCAWGTSKSIWPVLAIRVKSCCRSRSFASRATHDNNWLVLFAKQMLLLSLDEHDNPIRSTIVPMVHVMAGAVSLVAIEVDSFTGLITATAHSTWARPQRLQYKWVYPDWLKQCRVELLGAVVTNRSDWQPPNLLQTSCNFNDCAS